MKRCYHKNGIVHTWLPSGLKDFSPQAPNLPHGRTTYWAWHYYLPISLMDVLHTEHDIITFQSPSWTYYIHTEHDIITFSICQSHLMIMLVHKQRLFHLKWSPTNLAIGVFSLNIFCWQKLSYQYYHIIVSITCYMSSTGWYINRACYFKLAMVKTCSIWPFLNKYTVWKKLWSGSSDSNVAPYPLHSLRERSKNWKSTFCFDMVKMQ